MQITRMPLGTWKPAPRINGINFVKGNTTYWCGPLVLYYRRFTRAGSMFYGFLSGEMERVLPELVNSDEEGAKYINYTEIIPILTKAIQDLTLKVLEQEERIAELEQPSDHKTKP